MRLIDIPTEQTTAVTDAVLGVIATALVIYLWRFRRRDPWKVTLWSWVGGLLALGAMLGSIIHGVSLSSVTTRALWQPVYLSLAFVVVLVVIGAVADCFGRRTARRLFRLLIIVPVLFWIVVLVGKFSYRAFVIFELPGMVFALVVYVRLALGRCVAGASWMAAALFLTIAAAAIQATGVVHVTVFWPFDPNGVFHVVQAVAVVVLGVGLRLSLVAKISKETV